MLHDRKVNGKSFPQGPDGSDSPYLYEMLMPSGSGKRKMKPWQGIVVFVCLLVLFQLIGSLMFLVMGIYANGVAEMLFFFGGSLLTVRLLKLDIRDVFPVKKPGIQGILGTFLIWFGAYQCMSAISLVLAYLFPKAYMAVGNSMNSFVTGLPFLGSVIVIALVPAVSEEMLHRGLLQYSLQPLKRRWLILTCMGIYFGVFHLSLIRFLPMMFLGMVIAWLRQETGNMIYGVLFHFINNFFALAVTFLSEQAAGTVTSVQYSGLPLYLLGYYFLMAAAGPFLMYVGGWLVKRCVSQCRMPLFHGNRRQIKVLAAATIVLAAAGIILFAAGICMIF